MKTRFLSYLLLFTLMAGAPASAQLYLSTADTALYALDTVKVEASRYRKPLRTIPFSLSVVEARLTGSLKTDFSLDKVLAIVPGLQVDNRNNLAQGDRISIRGIGSRASFGVRGIKVILDDIPLTMPDGQTQMNNLDLAFVDRVEVLKGPSSSLYGNASGGVILLRSNEADQPGIICRVGATGGSFKSSRAYGSISGQVGKRQFSFNASKNNSEGFREHAQARFGNLNFVGRQRLSGRSEIGIVLNYFNAPYLLNPGSLTKQDSRDKPEMARAYIISQGSGKRVEQGQGGIFYRFTGERTQISSTVYGLFRTLFNAIPGRIIDLERGGGGLRTVLNRKISIGRVRGDVTVGNDLEWQSDERRESINLGVPEGDLPAKEILGSLIRGEKLLDQNERVTGNGTFLQVHLVPADGLSVLGGIRYDRFLFQVHDRFAADGLSQTGRRLMSNVSPMVGLTWSPKELLTFYGNFSTAFQTPTTTELSNRPSGAGGFNPELQPEQLENIELGFRGFWMSRRIQYSAAMYRIDIEGMLIPFQIQAPTSEEIYYRNAGTSRNRGAEIELGWYPNHQLEMILTYTRSDFRFVDYQIEGDGTAGALEQLRGNRVPGVSPNRFMLQTRYRAAPGFNLVLISRWFDRYYANDRNGGAGQNAADYINDAYWVADLTAEMEAIFLGTGIKFLFSINNLLDARYNGSIVPNAFGKRFFEPAPGRSFVGGIEIQLVGNKPKR